VGRLALLADEHVDRAFVGTLRQEGFDVATVNEDYHAGVDDKMHLEEAVSSGRVVLTNDADFTRLALDSDHAGIIRYSDQNHSPGEFVRALKRIDQHYSPREIRGRVEWLEQCL
jgi:predicted nuclease of predicted toxin-antitoxin system